ncbi:MAG TPA: hypothetical protein EYQ60_11605 [Myxococcales bacterium]|nr:hypothetical protein [Myxococcales bacterium]HIK83757.1 hypothetical protein [Myxococcales bacterium]
MPLGPPLRQPFYARDSRIVASELIGCLLVHRSPDGPRLVLKLVEVEAYRTKRQAAKNTSLTESDPGPR